ncbi:MAG: flagellar basal body rod protein FlgB [Acidimicrobiia bacterium]
MRWLGQRGGLVASNVARADIPGAQARDFEQSFVEAIRDPKPGRLPSSVTDARNIPPRPAGAGRVHDEKNVINISRNQISIEDEMMKLADIGAQHQLVANIYRKNAGLLRLMVRGR